jgi:hypothetical protein
LETEKTVDQLDKELLLGEIHMEVEKSIFIDQLQHGGLGNEIKKKLEKKPTYFEKLRWKISYNLYKFFRYF